LAEHMLILGRENVRRAGLHHCIRLERVDAKQMPYPDSSFGAVISNSIVHHIPEPAAVLAELVRVAAPGGTLFVRDLVRPTDDKMLQRLVTTYAGDGSDLQRKMFADSLLAALTLEEVRALVAALGFDGESVRQTADRHWTWSTRR